MCHKKAMYNGRSFMVNNFFPSLIFSFSLESLEYLPLFCQSQILPRQCLDRIRVCFKGVHLLHQFLVLCVKAGYITLYTVVFPLHSDIFYDPPLAEKKDKREIEANMAAPPEREFFLSRLIKPETLVLTVEKPSF